MASPGARLPSAHIASLDALRGLAALWVVAFHIWKRFYPASSPQSVPVESLPTDAWDSLMFCAFGFGFSGVTLFFVLSGLCIHLPQARDHARPLVIRTFAARRFWRLYPALAASVALTSIVLLLPKLLLFATRSRSFDWWAEAQGFNALVTLAFLQPIWPESLDFNGVYWTLVYEAQFYAAYPILLWLIRRTGLAPAGLALLAAEIYFAYQPLGIPCFFLARYFEWYLGVLAAEYIARAPTPERVPTGAFGALAAAGLAGGLYANFAPVLFPLRDLLWALGFCGLVLVASTGRTKLDRGLSWRPLLALGTVSYSLYLVHIPVIDVVWMSIDRLIMTRFPDTPAWRLLALSAVPASVAVASGFYVLFERPFFRTSPRPKGARSV